MYVPGGGRARHRLLANALTAQERSPTTMRLTTTRSRLGAIGATGLILAWLIAGGMPAGRRSSRRQTPRPNALRSRLPRRASADAHPGGNADEHAHPRPVAIVG